MSAYYEPEPGTRFDPDAIFVRCVESGAHALLLDEPAIPGSFFDLSTGLAGELLHKLGTYRMRLACVVPDLSVHPPRFQDFAREANQGHEYRFFESREQAIRWLQSDGRAAGSPDRA